MNASARTPTAASEIPLVRRFPGLAAIPRARLGVFPSPVERLTPDGRLWVKRDDLNAEEGGGNKVRSLEFLLGRVRPGDVVLTVGGEGSTHVLATALHGRRLGAHVVAVRWRHEMHPVAEQVGARAAALALRTHVFENVVLALPRAIAMRLAAMRTTGRTRHWIPLGGSSPLGVLGQVNAGLELAAQVEAGEMPEPDRVVVPLGTGGTAAGIALGLEIAGMRTTVLCARVGPRLAATRGRVMRLAAATRRLILRYSGGTVPSLGAGRVRVMHEVYGGAYGRPLPKAEEAAARLREATGIVLDSTYSAKAFAAALLASRTGEAPVLYWLTFDARWMQGAWALPESREAE